jgi:ribosome biogenesis GTPase / thiamine phosphate phosphatase
VTAAIQRGEVLYGINTIYTVRIEGELLECRIKGKQLKSAERSYNPIAPGDIVTVARDERQARRGMIHAVEARRTSLVRWNKKGRAPQVLAANADAAVCVTTPSSPPFRPRFIDRLIVAAETGGLVPRIVLNKSDLGCPDDVEERLQHYERMGYEVLRCSALDGTGLTGLAESLRGATTVIVGQSGVGKSSLVNALCPGLDLKVGALSVKHDRGNHTTIVSVLYAGGGELRLIDTPGVRELEIADVLPEEIGYHFREFTALMGGCSYQPCLHDDEPGCAVAAAVERGDVHPDRYESYLRILEELRESRRPGRG